MSRRFIFPDKKPTCTRCGDKISEKNASLYSWIQEGIYKPICINCWDFLRRFYAEGSLKTEDQINKEIEKENLSISDLKLIQEKTVYLENNFLQ